MSKKAAAPKKTATPAKGQGLLSKYFNTSTSAGPIGDLPKTDDSAREATKPTKKRGLDDVTETTEPKKSTPAKKAKAVASSQSKRRKLKDDSDDNDDDFIADDADMDVVSSDNESGVGEDDDSVVLDDSSEDEKPIKKAKKAGGKVGAKKVGKVAPIVESDDDDEATVLPSNTATLKSATIAGKAYSTVKERIQHIGFNQELHDKLVDFVCSDEYYERRSRYGQDDEQGDDDNAIDGMDDEGEEDAAPKKKPTAGQTTLTGAKKVGKAGTTYTPLEKQYLDIKAKYPDTILFVESGYKYCFFGKDAEVASKVLSIMAGMGKHFIQTSIPVHRLHVHARRLVQAGYKVGVVTQTETAALKKASTNKSGPFARALTSMYTKSTLVGGDMDPLSSNDAGVGVYLMGITESPVPSAAGSSDPSRVAISIVAVKTSTGDIIYDHFEDNFMRNELDSRLRHIQPVELLLPDSLAGPTRKLVELYKQQTASSITGKDNEARLEYAPATRFDADRAREQISATMKLTASMTATSTPIVVEAGDTPSAEEEMSSLLDQLPDQVVGLVGALMIYLKDFGLSGLFCLSMNYRSFSKAGHMRLDGSALANLELIRNLTDNSFRGSLLWVIDHTRTIFGRRMLMQWVQQPLVDVARITERLDAVAELALGGDIPIPLLNLYEKLANLPDLERGLCKVYYNKCGFDEFRTLLRAFKTICEAAPPIDTVDKIVKSTILRNILASVNPQLADSMNQYISLLNDDAKQSDKMSYFKFELADAFPKITKCRQKIKQIEDELEEHLGEVRKILGMSSLEYVTRMNDEYIIEISKSSKKIPGDWVSLKGCGEVWALSSRLIKVIDILYIDRTKALDRYHTPFIKERLRQLAESRETLVLESEAAWATTLRDFSAHYASLRQVVLALSSLDCIFSLTTVAKQDGYTRPTIADPCECQQLQIVAGRHPVVEALLPEPFVPNDVNMGNKRHSVYILTGPNMGGKTSFARQVALISVMAQIGSFVPARSATITPFDAIYTRMGAADDDARGKSTFFVELQETSEILHLASSRSLVILDELGRGTSTHDGYAIAYATLQHIIAKLNCLTLFVTHYPALSHLEKVHPNTVQNYHMGFLLNEDSTDQSEEADKSAPIITFLYKLVKGVEPRSYGLNVARLANLPSDLISVAKMHSSKLEAEVRTKSLEASVRMLYEVMVNCGETPDVDKFKQLQAQLSLVEARK